MVLMKDDWLIPVGCLLLAAAILSDRFLALQVPVLDFVIGLLTGIAIVFNLAGLYRMRSPKN